MIFELSEEDGRFVFPDRLAEYVLPIHRRSSCEVPRIIVTISEPHIPPHSNIMSSGEGRAKFWNAARAGQNCDALYEIGAVTVDERGIIRLGAGTALPTLGKDELETFVRSSGVLVGTVCPAWRVETSGYFTWHFETNRARDGIEIGRLQGVLRDFARERDWEQFHTPKNLVMALVGEVGELIEIFQWLKPKESSEIMATPGWAGRVHEELADVFGYVLRLADVLDVDLIEALESKIEANAEKNSQSDCFGSRIVRSLPSRMRALLPQDV